ncbi:hypothetical protein ACP70R_007943 [Stipagrostis hirtigluma subsp. patula]
MTLEETAAVARCYGREGAEGRATTELAQLGGPPPADAIGARGARHPLRHLHAAHRRLPRRGHASGGEKEKEGDL